MPRRTASSGGPGMHDGPTLHDSDGLRRRRHPARPPGPCHRRVPGRPQGMSMNPWANIGQVVTNHPHPHPPGSSCPACGCHSMIRVRGWHRPSCGRLSPASPGTGPPAMAGRRSAPRPWPARTIRGCRTGPRGGCAARSGRRAAAPVSAGPCGSGPSHRHGRRRSAGNPGAPSAGQGRCAGVTRWLMKRWGGTRVGPVPLPLIPGPTHDLNGMIPRHDDPGGGCGGASCPS